MPNKRISFTNIDKKVYYRAVPTSKSMRIASSISVIDECTRADASRGDLYDKCNVKEVLDGDISIKSHDYGGKAKKNLKSKRVNRDPHLMLIPHSCSDGVIEYEVKCKGTSKPFSKVRTVLTSEMKEKGMEAVKGLMSKVLKLKVFDGRTCFEASSHAHLN